MIIQKDLSLYCRIDIVNDQNFLHVEYNDKKNKRFDAFTLTEAVEIKNSAQNIDVKNLFYLLSSRGPE